MFDSIPSNFQSLYSELNYSFVSSASRDITISIYDAQSGELCGVKSLYDSSEATVNIAPIIRNYALPTPMKCDVGFVEANNLGYVSVVVEEQEGDTVDSRTFLLSRSDSLLSEILTSMPHQRAISRDESDMLTLRCEQGASLIATIRYYSYHEEQSIYERSFEYSDEGCGVAVFNFVMESALLNGELADIDLEYVTLTIEQQSDDEQAVELGQINYILIDPPATPLRLAWISSSGAIEHYTFPTIERMVRGTDAMLQITISSALESVQVRRMLSEIVSSLRVWLDRGDSYELISVVSQTIEITKVRELERMTITIECSDN